MTEVPVDDEPIVMADRAGVIRLWSVGAERMFGYPASEAIGRTLDLLVPEEHREAHWNGFRAALATGVATLEGQVVPFPAQHANGEVTPRPGRLTLVRGPGGDVAAAVVVFE